jgi:hypothetical protein
MFYKYRSNFAEIVGVPIFLRMLTPEMVYFLLSIKNVLIDVELMDVF